MSIIVKLNKTKKGIDHQDGKHRSAVAHTQCQELMMDVGFIRQEGALASAHTTHHYTDTSKQGIINTQKATTRALGILTSPLLPSIAKRMPNPAKMKPIV